MQKILVASLLTLAIALPVKAQVGPGAGAADVPAGGQGTYAYVCTRDRTGRLSLRAGLGQNYRKIKEVRNGNTLALITSAYDKAGFRWWNVYHNGSRGWVRADYVCGDPE